MVGWTGRTTIDGLGRGVRSGVGAHRIDDSRRDGFPGEVTIGTLGWRRAASRPPHGDVEVAVSGCARGPEAA
jgi:hypothetical protein